MRKITRGFSLVVVLTMACDRWPEPSPLSRADHEAALAQWRDARRTGLVRPGSGAITWIGLWDLPAGQFSIGADSGQDMRLTGSGVPGRIGTIVRTDSALRFTPAPRVPVTLGDSTPLTGPVDIVTDRSRSYSVIGVGSVRFRVHGEPGTDRLWVRAWDENHPQRPTFQLPEVYPLAAEWRVAARFDSFAVVRDIQVGDVVDGTQAYRSPGELVFRVAGKEYRLAASADSGSRDYFIMLWDSTATTTTYGAGRYLRVPIADSTGWTVIDFNRTYNPPCAFTAYSTCAFAPPENKLPFAITAGEKRVR